MKYNLTILNSEWYRFLKLS